MTFTVDQDVTHTLKRFFLLQRYTLPFIGNIQHIKSFKIKLFFKWGKNMVTTSFVESFPLMKLNNGVLTFLYFYVLSVGNTAQ